MPGGSRTLDLGIEIAGISCMDRRLEEMLRAQRGLYERQQHGGAVTAQELAAATGVSGWNVAKVVGVKERDGYVLAILPACCIVDLDRLKGLIGHGDVRLATVGEIERVTGGLAAGAIPPFGALYGLRTFVDRTLANQPEITMPAGDFGTSIRMRGTEYLRLARPVLGDFAVPEQVAQSAPRIRARRDTRPRTPGRHGRRARGTP
jgi:Ala-tRNA(Pro) deacylase